MSPDAFIERTFPRLLRSFWARRSCRTLGNVMLRGPLSKIDRGVSVALAVVWLVAGFAGLAAGALRASVPLMLVSLFVVAWGVAWALVALRGRLLGSAADRPARRRLRGR